MSSKIKKIFKKENKIVIGSLHLPPLLGFSDFPGFAKTIKMAIADTKAYQEGGVDALFIENNYGLSEEKITVANAVAMSRVIEEIKKVSKVPLGVSVLWNDYEAAFALCVAHDLKFIRIPVFVDTVEPYCGIIKGNPKHVKSVQKLMKAENVLIFADVLVKHSKHISKHTLEAATKKAFKAGADGVIVTGDWTGDAPTPETLTKLRKKIGSEFVLVGSGANMENISDLLHHANGVIVSTSLKKGKIIKGERNVKGFEQRVDKNKVASFTKATKN